MAVGDLGSPALRQAWFTRERILTLALLAATAIVFVLCYLLVRPFLSALAWALAFAVVAHPVHQWFDSRLRRRTLSAALTVVVVALALVGPMIFVTQQLVRESSRGAELLTEITDEEKWLAEMKQYPAMARLVYMAERQIDVRQELRNAAAKVAEAARSLVAGSMWGLLQLVIALFVLFYFYRDEHSLLLSLRSLIPLSNSEADVIFRRIADTINATVFGTIAVAFVQGTLGGVMFLILGLPAPVLWGLVMFLLSVVPIFGAFIVWIPAALFLASQGEWTKAVILTVWGSVVIGLIDNLLYPVLVGKRLRLHTVPVFFAILGGLVLFGASGIVLGPVILAVAIALVDVWWGRTVNGRRADDGSEPPAAAITGERVSHA